MSEKLGDFKTCDQIAQTLIQISIECPEHYDTLWDMLRVVDSLDSNPQTLVFRVFAFIDDTPMLSVHLQHVLYVKIRVF